MSENTNIRISKALKELNIGLDTAIEHLRKKGYEVDANPNAKITDVMHTELLKQFSSDKKIKEQAEKIAFGIRQPKKEITLDQSPISHGHNVDFEPEEILIKNVASTPSAKPIEDKTKVDEPVKETEKPIIEPIKVKAETVVVNPIVEQQPIAEQINTVSPEVIPEVKAAAEPTIINPEQIKPDLPVVENQKIDKEPTKPEPKDTISNVEKIKTQPDQPQLARVMGKIDLEPFKPKKQEYPKNQDAQKRPDDKYKGNKQASQQPRNPNPNKDNFKPVEAVVKPIEPVKEEELPIEVIRAKAEKLDGPTVVGHIDLSKLESRRKPNGPGANTDAAGKRKRKRKEASPVGGSTATGTAKPGANPANRNNNQPRTGGGYQGNNPNNTQRPSGQNQNAGGQQQRPNQGQGGQGQGQNRNQGPNRPNQNRNQGGQNRPGQVGAGAGQNRFVKKEEPTEKDISDQIKATMARLQGKQQTRTGNKTGGKRSRREEMQSRLGATEDGQNAKLQVTEFITTGDLANIMDVPVTEVIATFFSLGMMVSINQRLDAETITIVADEFGFDVEFIKADENEPDLEEPDNESQMLDRAPIVTIMGHVDHGKTSLLDHIRDTNVIAGEAGGITQHIGAYEVTLESGKKITFLDTPGHEAFTAMRARGAKVTDIVVIVIAADDSVMPQTKEAISHAQAAGVPLIFAINKIDRPEANPERIREQLAAMNILVESWGGKYQDQEISAKAGTNMELLMEKILLEAELLELKADPKKRAIGTVIEASLDKGKGIVATVLVQSGKLKMGDNILAGAHYGRVKALMNERGQRVKHVGPSQPVQILGFNGAPQAGDKIYVTENEQQAKDVANKRQQLIREQGLRTKKHITLDEIGRRLAIGDFQQLNIIVKGDVDGSVEALSDSLQKLSTEKIQVNIIHKGVGQISETDVLLASASDAIIVGFQVRPLPSVRKLAEHEEIDIRTYSIIYDAIDEVKAAMVGMLAPTFEEKVVCTIEIRETFKISKVGTIAGCMVLDGKVNRNTKIRVLRDGVVIHTGELASLKRYKDDVKEVNSGYECGLNINNFNDIKVGDILEGYERVEVKAKL